MIVHGLDAAERERGDDAAELVGQRDEGVERVAVLVGHHGRVDGVLDERAAEGAGHLLGDDRAGAVLGLGGGGAEVRRDDDVRQLEEGRLGERLLLEDVDGGAGEVAGAQGVDQRVGVHELAAAGVDQPHAGLHGRQAAGVDQVAGVGRGGRCRETQSASASASSMESARSAPRSRKRSADTNGS